MIDIIKFICKHPLNKDKEINSIFRDDEIHRDLINLGFESCTYNPFERKIVKMKSYGSHNTIYIKDKVFEKVEEIVKNATKFRCNGMEI